MSAPATGSRVAIATLDTLGTRMAGPAIRCWEMARLLSGNHEVRLVTFGGCTRTADGFSVEPTRVEAFREVVEWADVLVVQGYLGAAFPWLREVDVVLVVDLYDPFHIESLEVQRAEPLAERDWALAHALAELGFQVSRGDVFLCASERQRDLWIGHLAAAGRINPRTYDADPELTSLVRVAPFGVEPRPPQRGGPAIRGVVDGIGPDDPVLLWAGGVYNWFDPLTLIRAVDLIRNQVPDVRLVFMGMSHPNPDVPTMATAVATRALADELGLTGSHVFFHDGWVPYEQRADFLLDATIGVSCHLPGIETRYSFRTRILDYLWAGLPIVCTEGDVFADLVTGRDLGRAVPPRDARALADALVDVLQDDAGDAARRERVRQAGAEFIWPRALAPLVEACEHPRRAADHAVMAGPVGRRGAVRDLRAALRVLRTSGISGLVQRVRLRAGRRGR